MSPVKPSDFDDLLVRGDDTFCDALKKFLQAEVLFWQYFKYKYDEDGHFTAAYEAEICSASCFVPPEPETTQS